ncbi:MAG: HTH-type transcriptional regulator CymR [Firmicutes bacterium ADurb.Bin153]|nr:MAG: HTH-type transcriptional regulator CymR [Firmicutes bacterium ADurb.Bin153]HPU95721.1 Rrf2 family transcriptional regulator [Bacillota bacterium]
MKITARTEYGIRAMYALAKASGTGPLSMRSIASDQQIPENFLEQMLYQLRKAGLVTATRGPAGGYELARKPADISFSDIVTALEGPVAICDCIDTEGSCDRLHACPVHPVWAKIAAGLNDLLEKSTLADML